MSDPEAPKDQSNSADIPLEDIDRLLESMDPEFTKSLEEVRAVANDQDVTIEASAIDESLEAQFATQGTAETRSSSVWVRAKVHLRGSLGSARVKCSARLRSAAKEAVIFLRTRPKEFFFFTLVLSKVIYGKSLIPLRAYQDATRMQRLATCVLAVSAVASVWVMLANVRGVWLPSLNEPLLRSFEPVADFVETYSVKDEGESFYSAFPQERHEFLFPKIKVNLRRTSDSPNPMGAFEVIVLVDSKDTAIEVRDREVEFFDLLQRVFEEESFADLESELGKARLKARLKRELNQKLTQGWAKDISFKNFILKP